MAQAKPACGSHPHGCNANVLSIQYNTQVKERKSDHAIFYPQHKYGESSRFVKKNVYIRFYIGQYYVTRCRRRRC